MRRRAPIDRTGVWRAARLALGWGLVLAAPWDASAAPPDPACASWPGEPVPLPNTGSADPVLARWASLRSAELSAAARATDANTPIRALRLWQHVRCLDPSSDAAMRGIEATHAVQVHRPAVGEGRSSEPPGAPSTWARLDASIRVAPVAFQRTPTPARAPNTTAPAPPAVVDWKRTDAALGQAESQLREANFEAALSTADRVRRQLRSAAGSEGAPARRARAEVVAATAEIALGNEAAARKSFEQALAADPALRLDPNSTSPKVRRAFDAARGGSGRR